MGTPKPSPYLIYRRGSNGEWIARGRSHVKDLAADVLWTARCYPGDIKIQDTDTGNSIIGTAEEMAGIAEVMRIAKINVLSPLDRAEQLA